MNCIISKVFCGETNYYLENLSGGPLWNHKREKALRLTVDQARVLAGLIPGAVVEELKEEPKTLRQAVEEMAKNAVLAPFFWELAKVLNLPDAVPAPAGVPVEKLKELAGIFWRNSQQYRARAGTAKDSAKDVWGAKADSHAYAADATEHLIADHSK